MTLLSRAAFAAAFATFALPAAAEMVVEDGFARASTPNARAGAAFLRITNTGTEDDTLIAARSDVAQRIELHTHIDIGDGVMQMREVEAGFPIPAGATYEMKRGGDHVMFMGLNESLVQGVEVDLTLVFASGEELTVTVPVDLERGGAHGHGGHGHGGHGHGHDHGSDG
ncbi:MAG: copper chaperone PCu(A)C [Shimia sp.]